MKNFLFLFLAFCLAGCSMPTPENTKNSVVRNDAVEGSVNAAAGKTAQDALEVDEKPIPAAADATVPQNDAVKRGTFMYYADAATFTECGTGKKYAVGGDAYLSMEKSYLSKRTKDFQEIYVEVSGDYKTEDGAENGTKAATLIANKMMLMDVAKSCN